jgi:hypothetical protein
MPTSPDIIGVISAAKLSFANPLFIGILIAAVWCIWKQRNKRIFEKINPLRCTVPHSSSVNILVPLNTILLPGPFLKVYESKQKLHI